MDPKPDSFHFLLGLYYILIVNCMFYDVLAFFIKMCIMYVPRCGLISISRLTTGLLSFVTFYVSYCVLFLHGVFICAKLAFIQYSAICEYV